MMIRNNGVGSIEKYKWVTWKILIDKEQRTLRSIRYFCFDEAGVESWFDRPLKLPVLGSSSLF
jgi:hypothetical protein